MKQFKTIIITIASILGVFLAACGNESNNGADSGIGLMQVETVYGLGECEIVTEGVVKFVISEDKHYTCRSGVWQSEAEKVSSGNDGGPEKDEVRSSSETSSELAESSSSSSAGIESSSSSSEGETSSSLSNSSGSNAACEGSEYDDTSGMLKDCRDGFVKVYRTVQIGKQIWMADNLNYDNNEWYAGTDWICFNGISSCDKYGRLYIWEQAKKACPTGWHLPSKAEFEALIDAVGGEDVAGIMLKSTSGWYREGNGLDKYGFSALPGGFAHNERPQGDGEYADFWSSSVDDDVHSITYNSAYYMNLYYFNDYARLVYGTKDNMLSVRCLKDEYIENKE